jgi:hypothetical protein
VGEPRDVIAEEVTGAKVGEDLLDRGRAGEFFYGLDQFGTGERLALSQLIAQKLTTGLAPAAFCDADLEPVLEQACENCSDGSHMLSPGDGVDHHIVEEDLAESPASIRVYQVTQDTVSQSLKVGRPVGQAHAEALVLAEAKAARVETGLVPVLWVEQDSVERALQVDGCEELGVPNLSDEVFCSWEGPAIFAGLGVHTSHVNAEAGVAILLGHKKWIGGPGSGTRFSDVCSVILLDALVEQFLLMVGQASLAFPIRFCVTSVYAEVTMLRRVHCADIKFVQADDPLQFCK